MSANGTKRDATCRRGRSAVEGEAGVRRTHHPFVLMTQSGLPIYLSEWLRRVGLQFLAHHEPTA